MLSREVQDPSFGRPCRTLHCVAQGKRVVRLKGGCPSTFSRVSGEMAALAAAGVPFRLVPGVSSVLAAPLLAGGTHQPLQTLLNSFPPTSKHLIRSCTVRKSIMLKGLYFRLAQAFRSLTRTSAAASPSSAGTTRTPSTGSRCAVSTHSCS